MTQSLDSSAAPAAVSEQIAAAMRSSWADPGDVNRPEPESMCDGALARLRTAWTAAPKPSRLAFLAEAGAHFMLWEMIS